MTALDDRSIEEQMRLVQRTPATDVTWLPNVKEYAAQWGLTPEDVEKIVHAKGRSAIDAHTADVGYLVVRYYAGDVVIVVGYQQLRHPKVLSVFVEGSMPDSSSGSKTPSKGGSTAPTSIRALTKRIVDAGYRVEYDGPHGKVIDTDGDFLMSLPNTPSGPRSIQNTWALFLRKDAQRKFLAE